MSKNFGIAFEKVGDKFRVHKSEKPTVDRDDKIEIDGKKYYVSDIKLPVRADKRSAGYDFFLASDVEILPAQKTIIFTDVKAKMPDDVVLELYIRSSLAVKQGLMLSNSVGIIDASYYSNPDNDGNIGIAVVNTSGKAIKLSKGDRIAQGIFKPYFLTDEDSVLDEERKGGFGSSGK